MAFVPPRKVSTVAIAIGGLISFFVFGLLFPHSYPISSSFSRIFYELPLSFSNHTVKDLHNVYTSGQNLTSPSRFDSPDVAKKLEIPKEGTVPLDTTNVGSGESQTNVSMAGDTTNPLSPPHDSSETTSAETVGFMILWDLCILTQMQNCQSNGRPDKGYKNWRWKPSQCDLPRFDAKKFLKLMKGKTLAFIGDSVARNQMESMLCLLWQDGIVGGHLWWPDTSKPMKVNNIEAFGISVGTILKSMVTHPNYTGLSIVRTFSPDHYEGGAWNKGGSCTGKEEPILPGKLVKNGFTEIMREKQVTRFSRVADTLKVKLKLMDITEAFGYRHDGHPSPYRNLDPNKITRRGPDERPPPQDCLLWCMLGTIDTWNEMLLELLRRDVEGKKRIS